MVESLSPPVYIEVRVCSLRGRKEGRKEINGGKEMEGGGKEN